MFSMRPVLTHVRMLFDFHQKQNARKANSIHATYLISGTKRSADDTNGTNGRNGEDISMRSSPFMSSMPEAEDAELEEESVKESILLLVREEELESKEDRTHQINNRADDACRNSGRALRGDLHPHLQLRAGTTRGMTGKSDNRTRAKNNRTWTYWQHATARRMLSLQTMTPWNGGACMDPFRTLTSR